MYKTTNLILYIMYNQRLLSWTKRSIRDLSTLPCIKTATIGRRNKTSRGGPSCWKPHLTWNIMQWPNLVLNSCHILDHVSLVHFLDRECRSQCWRFSSGRRMVEIVTFLLYFTDCVPILFHFFIGNGGWSKLLCNVN